ncbi:hypothetical protein MtrunA17_Chr4g0018871 [Medicago truncatula]|uniref:Transmembrane protein n=1 Tax=Medicago truncatula TaxID=3880 RepID=A0A396IAJ8_MEDTR|nr:hypothetical protein MtrunA17_Chr4g0018871 [Medicago truncatula]
MLLLIHKTRCAAVLIRPDVVQMSRHCSQSLFWSVDLSVLAVSSYTMSEKMGLVLFRSVSGLIMMLANVLLLQDHDVLRNMSSRLEIVMYMLSIVVANGGYGCYRVGGAQTR